MSRHRIRIHKDESDGHANRPWVYFMVDCFFLITQFFLVSFQVKAEKFILPGKFPPGSTGPVRATRDEVLAIHVLLKNGQSMYLFQGQVSSIAELDTVLQRTKTSGRKLSVQLSYEAGVSWQGVIDVINACSRADIHNVGMVPLRADQARP